MKTPDPKRAAKLHPRIAVTHRAAGSAAVWRSAPDGNIVPSEV
ncbi:hypothetical protein [Sphingomonas ginsenosidivorax]|nr:hypothetical protein [Sphingomonas ginsenosidivorax]